MKKRIPLGTWINIMVDTVMDEFRGQYSKAQQEHFRAVDDKSDPGVRAGWLMGYNDALTHVRKTIPDGVLRDVRVEIQPPPAAQTLN